MQCDDRCRGVAQSGFSGPSLRSIGVEGGAKGPWRSCTEVRQDAIWPFNGRKLSVPASGRRIRAIQWSETLCSRFGAKDTSRPPHARQREAHGAQSRYIGHRGPGRSEDVPLGVARDERRNEAGARCSSDGHSLRCRFGDMVNCTVAFSIRGCTWRQLAPSDVIRVSCVSSTAQDGKGSLGKWEDKPYHLLARVGHLPFRSRHSSLHQVMAS